MMCVSWWFFYREDHQILYEKGDCILWQMKKVYG